MTHAARADRPRSARAAVRRWSPRGCSPYGEICGWTLARAHARSGDRIALAAYLGNGPSFDVAVQEFAEFHADQNERDHRSTRSPRAGSPPNPGSERGGVAAGPLGPAVGGRAQRGRSGTLTAQGLRAHARRLETTFPGRCASSFVALQGIDRALVLASQAFTALIPLLLLISALAPADQRDVVSHAIVGRFRLTGDAAAAVDQLFAHSGSGSIGLLSGFLLVFSGVSLTRRMQRMYQQAWGLDAPPGVGHTLHAALGLTALVAGLSLLYVVRALVGSLPWSDLPVLTASAGAGFVLYTTVPWLLLDRRVGWRRLVPTGLLTAVFTSAYGAASTVYMPHLMETYSRRYGLFGVTLALVGWLLAVAVILVASAVVAAEFDRAPEPWARRLRTRLLGRTVAAGDGPVPFMRTG